MRSSISYYFNVPGCDALSFSFAFTHYENEDDKDMVFSMKISMPKDKNVIADVSISIPTAHYSNKPEIHRFEKSVWRSIKYFNREQVLNPVTGFIKNNFMNIIVKGTFKLVPKISQPIGFRPKILRPKPAVKSPLAEQPRTPSFLENDAMDLVVDGRKIIVSGFN